MDRQVLFITGGSSFLGRSLIPLATPGFDVHYSYFTHRPLQSATGHKLDVRQSPEVDQLLQQIQPDIVMHLAGSNRSPDMEAVIREGTAHVTAATTAVGARLIHMSTDVLFDGTQAPYTTSDAPTPIHAYGRAKADAEATVASYPNHIIVRTSLIYGTKEPGHGTRWLMQALAAGKRVTLFTDQWRNPIWVETLSKALLELIPLKFSGILHIAGRQAMTRAAFGVRMLDHFDFHQRDMLQFGRGDSQKWPADVRLDCSRAAALLRTPLLGVDEVLKQAR